MRFGGGGELDHYGEGWLRSARFFAPGGELLRKGNSLTYPKGGKNAKTRRVREGALRGRRCWGYLTKVGNPTEKRGTTGKGPQIETKAVLEGAFNLGMEPSSKKRKKSQGCGRIELKDKGGDRYLIKSRETLSGNPH